jgi:glycosyltransferase involved in cell wall biosynthesis
MLDGISIIIPHYNSSELLFKLLETIDLDNSIFEVIIIDDKSNAEEIKKIKESKYYPKVIFIENKGKKNAGTCRNIGINTSSRKWMLFADADDFFIYDLNKLYEEIKERKEDIIYYIPISCYSDTLELAERHIVYKALLENYLNLGTKESLEKLKYNWGTPWSKIIKSEIVKKNNIMYDECLASNDIMFSMRLAYIARRIGAENKSFYCITTRKGSLTNTMSEKIFDAKFEVLKRRNIFLKEIKLEKYANTGIGFLKISYKYGINKFIKVLIYNISHLTYLKNNIKNYKSFFKILLKKNKYIIEK